MVENMKKAWSTDLQTERNEYIDFLRGIGAFGIVAIHTAFWSGQSYTPQWFWNITLFLDVPFFFFLSGWGSSYSKANVKKMVKSIARIWGKWIFFLFILEIMSLILSRTVILTDVGTIGLTDLRDFTNNIFFKVSFPEFPVVAGSIWFMPVYYVVIFGNTIILALLQRIDTEWETSTYLCVIISIFVWIYNGNYFFGLDLAQYLFYSAFWILGYRMKNFAHDHMNRYKNLKNTISNLFIIVIGIFITNYLQGLQVCDIQSAKFPPSPKYAFVSLVSVEIAKFFYNEEYKGTLFKLFSHVGQNAIFYYFGQGVGSSLIYYYVRNVQLSNWFIKWLGAFGINIVITVMLAEFMSFLYEKYREYRTRLFIR